MTEFTKKIRSKGWTAKEVALRWGITPVWLSIIAKNPPRKYLDALNGLPDRSKHE